MNTATRSLTRVFTALACLCLGGGAAPTILAQAAKPPVDPSLVQALEWRNIGPFRGGRAIAVTGVPSDPLTFYFGSAGGGVWKTVDGGETWRSISDATFKTSSVGAIAVAPSDPNVVYVGMGEHSVRGVMTSHGDGVYKSTDGGRTWTHVGLDLTRAISRIRIHPDNPELVYVAAQGAPYGSNKERGIYRSADGGKTWQLVLHVSEDAGASDLAMDPHNPRVLYAAFWDHRRLPWQVRSGGPGSGIHKSTDGGSTWQRLAGFPDLVGKTSVATTPDPERVYAIIEADPKGGVYRSDDAGKTWSLVNEEWKIKSRSWYYMEIYGDPRNADVVWVANAGLHKSIDGGRTFTDVRAPHGDHHDLWISPTNTQVVINANDGGATVSFNGGRTWSTEDNQPTAQFYRVNTDNQFPYYVYGGQQDNTSVAIASRGRGGIDVTDWHDVGGCESASPAFNPAEPTLVYAGCYMGIISEWNAKTGVSRDIMAYPMMAAALAPRDMKYRFNWNAPIVVSQHNPATIYHGGNLVLKSTNRGQTWTEISPDLTRNEKDKQGPGGAPITNEGAGGEIYGTLAFIAESPLEPSTLWTGSDDGFVHVTRDGGKSWSNVTPAAIKDQASLIHSIEVSPHDAATAYITVTRYKFNDFTPLVFKTADYGRTWTKLVDGIEPDAWARVVREDPQRKDLLYLGTELGFYVSWDGGRRWQRMQLNLPMTPINDLQVHGNDVVAATGGRAFWVLDDLSPLRQMDPRIKDSAVHLFKTAPAIRTEGFGAGGGDPASRKGKNPPSGAVIDYYLQKVPEGGVTIEILDSAKSVIRRYATTPVKGAPAGQKPLAVKAGGNRLVWDLRHEQVKPVPGLFVFGSLEGRHVVPGTYEVRVTGGGTSESQALEVRKDPRVDASPGDFAAQDELMKRVDGDLTELHEAVINLRAVRAQVEDLTTRMRSHKETATLGAAGKAIVDKLNGIEDALVATRVVDGQTVINFPMRLDGFYIYLRNAVDGSEAGGVTDGARTRYADLSAEWNRQKAALAQALGADVEAFNKQVRAAGVDAITIPK